MSFLTILWFIIVALVPGLFWLWFYRRQDSKSDPEPLRLIFKIFLWGAAMALPAVALEFAADFFLGFSQSKNFFVLAFAALFIVAPIEEFLKYWVVRQKIFNHPAFSEPLDGIIYCVSAGLGFASFENLLVVFSEGEGAVFLRFATATLMHALASGMVGFYLGKMKFQKSGSSIVWLGLIFAILLHGLYNIIVTMSTSFTLGLLVILMVVMYFILSSEIKEMKAMKIKKVDKV